MVIMSFIHKTLRFESRALLFGEIKYYFARGGEKGLEHCEPLRGLQGLPNLYPARLKSSRRRRNARPAALIKIVC